MVLQEVVRAEMTEVDELTDTARSQGGFGHTGV
jgi:dUTPase